MSFVYRQSPEQIASSVRHNTRRAMAGVAAGFAALVGMSILVVPEIAHTIDKFHAAAEATLIPKAEPESTQTQTQAQTHTTDTTTGHQDTLVPVRYAKAQTSPTPESPQDNGWEGVASIWGIAGFTSLGSLVALGKLSSSRGKRPNNDTLTTKEEGYDIATGQHYATYPFETTLATQTVIYDDIAHRLKYGAEQLDEIDARSVAAEQTANAALISARLGSPLNIADMHILTELGCDPLDALRHSVASEAYKETPLLIYPDVRLDPDLAI